MNYSKKTFMDCLQERICNKKQPIYNMQDPQQIYYQAFNDPDNDDQTYYPMGQSELTSRLSTLMNPI